MAIHHIHLNKSGSGMASKTACGRNVLRTPLSTDWEGFKTEAYRCIKCEQSKQFEVNTRMDAKKAAAADVITDEDLDKWEPEAEGQWLINDRKLIAAHHARQ